MKKAFLTMALVAATIGMYAQTADEVINKFVQASGGRKKLEAINTLHYKQLIKFKSPMGELEIPVNFYREKDKFFRVQASLQFGPQSLNFFTIITDTAGYIMMPPNPLNGDEGGLKKLAEEDREQQWGQTDVTGMFGQLVNYASSGFTAELLPSEKVGSTDCYQVKLSNKQGQSATYFISKATSLLLKQVSKGTVAANSTGLGGVLGSLGAADKANDMEVTMVYDAYTPVDGILFPTRLTITTPVGESEAVLSDIKVNKPIDTKLYLPQ